MREPLVHAEATAGGATPPGMLRGNVEPAVDPGHDGDVAVVAAGAPLRGTLPVVIAGGSPSPTATPSASPSVAPSATPSPTATPSPSPTPSPSASPSESPSESPSAEPSPSETESAALKRAEEMYCHAHYDLSVIEVWRALEARLRRALLLKSVRGQFGDWNTLRDAAHAAGLLSKVPLTALDELRRHWQVAVYVNGRQICRSTHTTNKRRAQQVLAQLETQAFEERFHVPTSKPPYFEEWADVFLATIPIRTLGNVTHHPSPN